MTEPMAVSRLRALMAGPIDTKATIPRSEEERVALATLRLLWEWRVVRPA